MYPPQGLGLSQVQGWRVGKSLKLLEPRSPQEKPNACPAEPTHPYQQKEALWPERHTQTEGQPDRGVNLRSRAPGAQLRGPLSSPGPHTTPPAPDSHLTTLSSSPPHPGTHNHPAQKHTVSDFGWARGPELRTSGDQSCVSQGLLGAQMGISEQQGVRWVEWEGPGAAGM